MSQHIEVAVGDFTKRGGVMTFNELPALRSRLYASRTSAWRSYFTFDEEGAAYIKSSGSMNAGYQGAVGCDRILLDYEVENNPDEAGKVLQEIRYIIKHLTSSMDVDHTWIRVWYSGMKGFHMELPNLFGIEPGIETASSLKESIIANLSHPMLDTAPLFNAGLIRLEWTAHNKSGLFKIPLLTQEVYNLSIEEIQLMAADPIVSRDGFCYPIQDGVIPIWKNIRSAGKAVAKLNIGATKRGQQIKYNPTRVVTCMQNLVNRGPLEGRRSKDMLRLAAWMWKGGIPVEWAVENLLNWVGTDDADELQKMEQNIRRTYQRGYLYSCKDEVMREFCDPKCVFFQSKDYAIHVDDPRSLSEQYATFLQKIKEGGSIDLGRLFGGEKYVVLPAEVVMITGDTGMAKTMFIQNLVIKAKLDTLWLNLEMAGHLNFRRFAQIAFNWNKHQAADFFLNAPPAEKQDVFDRLNWLRQESISPTISKIEQMIVQCDPQVLVIDTTDAIDIPEAGGNSNLLIRIVMKEMRKLAERYQITIICIHHITKAGSKESTEGRVVGKNVQIRKLTLNDLTGDRSNVTKVDHVFAMEGDRHSDLRTLRSLKTRDGGAVQYEFFVDWDTMRFHGLQEQQ